MTASSLHLGRRGSSSAAASSHRRGDRLVDLRCWPPTLRLRRGSMPAGRSGNPTLRVGLGLGEAMPTKKKRPFDPEALKLMRAEVTAVHAAVQFAGPQPGGPRFASEKLTHLYGEVSQLGFDSFSLEPSGGARMATLPLREARIAVDSTSLWEELGLSGSALRSFAELADILMKKVESNLDVRGFQALHLRLVAFWPVPEGDAYAFVSKATRLPPVVTATLGPGFSVAGIRFHRNEKSGNQTDEWDVRVEPVLRQKDQLWIELQQIVTRTTPHGGEISQLLEHADKYLRHEATDAVLAMAGNRRGS